MSLTAPVRWGEYPDSADGGAALLRMEETILILGQIQARAGYMENLPFKKVLGLILLGGLVLTVAACATGEPWWQGKPVSQMTPAALEEQDPLFWPLWQDLYEDRL